MIALFENLAKGSVNRDELTVFYRENTLEITVP